MTQKTSMTGKEKRMAKAARLHYMQDMNYQEISDEIGVSYSTVRKYFADDQIEQLKRHFSDQQLFRLQRKLEQQVKDAENIAHDCVGKAKQLADSSRAYNKTAKTALEIPEKKIKLLQELGVVQKPKERKQVEKTNSSEDEFAERLQEAYQEQQKQEERQEKEEEVEAE